MVETIQRRRFSIAHGLNRGLWKGKTAKTVSTVSPDSIFCYLKNLDPIALPGLPGYEHAEKPFSNQSWVEGDVREAKKPGYSFTNFLTVVPSLIK